MTKPLYTPAYKEQEVKPHNDATTVYNAMNLLLPDLQEQEGAKQLIKQYLFGSGDTPSIIIIEAFLKENSIDISVLPDFLDILEGAKIAVTAFGLDNSQKLEVFLEQKYQMHEPEISSKPGFPVTDYS